MYPSVTVGEIHEIPLMYIYLCHVLADGTDERMLKHTDFPARHIVNRFERIPKRAARVPPIARALVTAAVTVIPPRKVVKVVHRALYDLGADSRILLDKRGDVKDV